MVILEKEKLDKKYANKSLLLFTFFIIIVMYVDTMLIPSLPSISKQFNVDAAQVSLILSMYLVSGVAFNPIVGSLGDIYGKKKVLVRILGIYTISVALAGFAPSFPILLALRTIQGIGLTIFPLILSLVQEQFPREQVPKALGIIGAMFGAGAAIGLPLGSFVANNYGWQTTYHSAIPFVALSSILIYFFIRESKYTKPDVKVDYVGSIGLAAFLAMLVFALSNGTSYGWTSPVILGLVAVALIVLFFVYRYERTIKHALLDMELLKIRNVFTANMIALIVGLGFFLAYQTLAYEFESPIPIGYGESIFLTGLSMLPFAIMMLLVAPVVGNTISKYGTKPFYLAGCIISIIGFLIAALSSSALQLSFAALFIGAGLSALNLPNFNLLLLSIDRKKAGLASSLNIVLSFLGSSLGAPIAGIFIAAFGTKVSFQYSFYFAIVAFAIVAILSLFANEVLGPKATVKHKPEEVIKEF